MPDSSALCSSLAWHSNVFCYSCFEIIAFCAFDCRDILLSLVEHKCYTYTHTHTHTHTYMYTCVCVHVCIHMYMCVNLTPSSLTKSLFSPAKYMHAQHKCVCNTHTHTHHTPPTPIIPTFSIFFFSSENWHTRPIAPSEVVFNKK